uniref:peptidyl-prolyl cis-trans isomerase-like 4 n=1 Tax=Ciona intestinalis TaxID=7719 RepID=UPI0000522093|nr:peptidyl-prolyl cis-trans isomerase-like 4 [Ciona intestinalis]|eukprot:XP_002131898.1 peptidyl-prolyl cis-trans isomerase-like 4 [Ciona intestinalis]
MSVIIETTVGDIVVDLYVKERPRACLNFLKLCKVKYYNYCLFHSVQRNFVAQTGDPTGSGRGGESIFRSLYGDQAKFFDAEKVPKIKHKKAGTVSMVNDGNGFHGSQFLITLGENLDSLDGIHTVFGCIAEGFDVILKINETFCDNQHRPFQDIRVTHTVILDDPLDDPPGLVIPDHSPEPTKEQIEGCFRIGADEALQDEEEDEEVVAEKEESKDADHRAQVLEIIGDIPDKDVKPPDNVLFVCKLNAVTTDEDLEIIFSRFGTIISCEIIRDYKTGDSLQYAFVEFETPDMCEKAYQKMDNVLIDDRRIHVDFSQSVSKLNFPRFNATKKSNEEISNKSIRRQKTPDSPDQKYKRRHRDVTPPVRHNQNRRDVPPRNRPNDHSLRRRHREESPVSRDRDVSHRRHRDVEDRRHQRPDSHSNSRGRYPSSNNSRSEPNRNTRRSRTPVSSSSESEEKGRKKRAEKKRVKEQKRRKRYSTSSASEAEDLSSDKEVRCGKHRKRSVSNHKDEKAKKKKKKHRT